MQYWEMNIWKVNEFNYLSEEVEEFTSKCCQNLVNVRNHSYLKQKTFEYFLWGINYIFIFPFGHGDMVMCC